MSSKLTDDEVTATRAVLYFYGHPKGWEAGGFTMSLIELWCKADLTNKARIRLAFPEVAGALETVNSELGGLEKLAERVT